MKQANDAFDSVSKMHVEKNTSMQSGIIEWTAGLIAVFKRDPSSKRHL